MKDLDKIDIHILDVLQQDGKTTIKDLATELSMSNTPVFERVKKLERSGVIDHYAAVLNPEKLGLKLNAFAHISLKDHGKKIVESFVQDIVALDEVMECHYSAGGADFIIKILVEDMEAYNLFVTEKLLDIPNIGKLESYFSLSVKKQRGRIRPLS